MPRPMNEAELKLRRAAGLAKKEQHDTYNLAVLCISLHDELFDFHSHAIDQGWHICEGIPGGCPVLNMLAKVGTQVEPTVTQTGNEKMP